MKIDYRKLYRDRLEEVVKQISLAVRHKDWATKNKLETEKQDLLKKLNMG